MTNKAADLRAPEPSTGSGAATADPVKPADNGGTPPVASSALFRRRGVRSRALPDGLGKLRLTVWAVLALVVLVPLVTVISTGARGENLRMLTDPDVLDAAANTLMSAAGSAVLATLAGAVLAVVLDRTDIPGRRALRWVFLLPFLIPPFIGAMAWMALLGPMVRSTRCSKPSPVPTRR